MEKESKNYSIGELQQILKKLVANRNKLEKQLYAVGYLQEDLPDFEEQDDTEYTISKYHYITAEIERIQKILERAKQYEEYKGKYPNGYKRTIREQRYKDVEDRLNRKEEAGKIAKIIFEKKVKTIGIFGEWGTGKSTFLEYIKDELLHDKTKIIDIKATEYSDQEGIWAYFFAMMKESIKKDMVKKICYFMLRLKKNIPQIFLPLMYAVITAVFMWVLFKYDFFISFGEIVNMDEKEAVIFNDGMNVFVSLVFIIKWVIPFLNEIKDNILIIFRQGSIITRRTVKEKLGYKLIVKEYIREILDTWKDYRFIFCVDELDRCNNASIMSFLESIQLLEDFPSIQIIYAIDAEIILNAIKESGIRNPHNFLKKYVDLKYDLISINSQADYIKSLAKEYEFDEKEIKSILNALEHLEVNVSVRDYISILNSLSELKARWIEEDVMTDKCYDREMCDSAIDWYEAIFTAVFFFAGSFWPTKIYRDLNSDNVGFNVEHLYVSVWKAVNDHEKQSEYEDCPILLMDTCVLDVLNVMSVLREMPPIYKDAFKGM